MLNNLSMMLMYGCNNITKHGNKCGRIASHRIGCKLLCWQHARQVGMFVKKGEQCNDKLLQKFYSIRKPFLGLGISGKITGISGSLSVGSIFKIFKILYEPNTCFIDIGAADGYMLIMAILHGYKNSIGIEYQKGDSGLKDIFDTIWNTLVLQTKFLSYAWSRNKPTLYYNTTIDSINQSVFNNNKKIHFFSFWDGFSVQDSEKLLKSIKYYNVGKICLVSRRSKQFGTFEKIKAQTDYEINEIASIDVFYRKEKYNAVIFSIK